MPGVAFRGSYCNGACGFPPAPSAAWSGNVFANGNNVCRQGDAFVPHPHSRVVASGSSTVFVNNKQTARIGDPLTCGAFIATGSGNVLIGG